MVERRLRAHLVKSNAERLGGVKGANNRIGDTRQPARLLSSDFLLVPAHEHMFANQQDGHTDGDCPIWESLDYPIGHSSLVAGS